jgi:hypothetical protein
MSITRKFAIPAAITTAAIAPAGAAAAATVPHNGHAATPTQASPRRARAIDILDHGPGGIRPDTAHRSNKSSGGDTAIYFYLYGTGSYVSATDVSVCVNSHVGWDKAHIEIVKPSGAAEKNGPTVNIGDGTANGPCTYLDVQPKIHDKGKWKAILWQKSGSYYDDVVSTYINVGG